jgi:predicted house-cleaning NTP pyrophosphatase (Maf/HAM1 superfamily)
MASFIVYRSRAQAKPAAKADSKARREVQDDISHSVPTGNLQFKRGSVIDTFQRQTSKVRNRALTHLTHKGQTYLEMAEEQQKAKEASYNRQGSRVLNISNDQSVYETMAPAKKTNPGVYENEDDEA